MGPEESYDAEFVDKLGHRETRIAILFMEDLAYVLSLKTPVEFESPIASKPFHANIAEIPGLCSTTEAKVAPMRISNEE